MYFLISCLKKTNKLCSTEYISTPRSNMIICKIYNKMLQNSLNPYTTYDIWWCESASFSAFATVINWFLLSPDSWPESLCTDISKPLSVQQHFTFLFWISSHCQFCVWTLTSSVSHLLFRCDWHLRRFLFVQYCEELWSYCGAEHSHLHECRHDSLIHCTGLS